MISGRTKPSVGENRCLLSESCPSIGSHAMPRLFTGLEIPAEIGHTLSSLRGGLPGARWIDPENYHVTLRLDRKSTRLNSSHTVISYAVFCLKKKKNNTLNDSVTR